jgi:hypothetical protein
MLAVRDQHSAVSYQLSVDALDNDAQLGAHGFAEGRLCEL